MKTIALIGTFDSKGVEYAYVKQIIENLGLKTFTVHMGVFEPALLPDVSNADVAKEVGVDIKDVVSKKESRMGDRSII